MKMTRPPLPAPVKTEQTNVKPPAPAPTNPGPAIETVPLKRVSQARHQVFDTFVPVIEKYNQTAKRISSGPIAVSPPKVAVAPSAVKPMPVQMRNVPTIPATKPPVLIAKLPAPHTTTAVRPVALR
jgi:hypothetical protein